MCRSRGDKMKEYLYLIRPVRPELLTDGPTAQEREYLGKHFSYLQKLTDEGVVILAGRTLNTDPSSFGIVIFLAKDDEAAERIMNDDPAVHGGVMTAELFPYSVALMTKRRFDK